MQAENFEEVWMMMMRECVLEVLSEDLVSHQSLDESLLLDLKSPPLS